jgi:hypothetical protein
MQQRRFPRPWRFEPIIYVGEAQCCLDFRQISNKFAVSMIAVSGTGVGYMLCHNQILQKKEQPEQSLPTPPVRPRPKPVVQY